jgi:hypothetical protein
MEATTPRLVQALGRRPNDIDPALEIRAVLDHNSGGLDVAFKAGTRAKHEAPDGLDVAFRRAGHDHLTGLDVRIGLPARPDGETAVHFHLAFPLAVQMDLLAARHSALNPHCLTDDSNARNRATSGSGEKILVFAHKHLSQQADWTSETQCISFIGKTLEPIVLAAAAFSLSSALCYH